MPKSISTYDVRLSFYLNELVLADLESFGGFDRQRIAQTWLDQALTDGGVRELLIEWLAMRADAQWDVTKTFRRIIGTLPRRSAN